MPTHTHTHTLTNVCVCVCVCFLPGVQCVSAVQQSCQHKAMSSETDDAAKFSH